MPGVILVGLEKESAGKGRQVHSGQGVTIAVSRTLSSGLFIRCANCLFGAEISNDENSMQKEERRRFPKRRRIGTNAFSGIVISVQSNQSHRLGEENVAAEATNMSAISPHIGSEAVVLCDSDVRADSAMLQPESSADSPDIQGQAIGTRH